MATKTTPAAPKATADEGLTVLSNDTIQIVDNTDATEVEVVEVQTEEYPLVGELVQVNYI